MQLASLAMGGRFRSPVYSTEVLERTDNWWRLTKETTELLSTNTYKCEPDARWTYLLLYGNLLSDSIGQKVAHRLFTGGSRRYSPM